MKYCLFLLIFFTAICQANNLYAFHSQRHENQFQQLLSQLRCVVCQNQNLASSNAKIAVDLRAKVYKMVKDDHSNRYIEKYMTDRYGDFILLKPPFLRATFFLWIFPFVMLSAGIWVYYRAIRRHQKRSWRSHYQRSTTVRATE